MMTTQKQKVIHFLKSFETKELTALEMLHPSKFVQHNADIESGVEGMAKFIRALDAETNIDIKRIFEDGDYVFAHVESKAVKCVISFHVFKFSEEKIVEHWANVQENQPLNLSGRSMIDGETTIHDQEKTMQNKQLAEQLVKDVFCEGRADKLSSYFDGESYIQHNPWLSDDVFSIRKVITDWVKTDQTMKYEIIHKVLGEGNFVLLMSEGHFFNKQTSFYDLFRFERGKIAEHWDNFESITPQSERKNNHSKF